MTPRRLPAVLLGTLMLLSILWVGAQATWPTPLTYFSFRKFFVQYSGVIAIGAMSLGMVLALRSRWIETRLDGLDKVYRLHKWLGITALVGSVAHWWFAQGTKWMVGWGWLTRPPRGPRPNPADQGVIEAWLGSQRGLAESVGEWAFYAAALLMVLALARRFPYRIFAKTHTLLALTYLVLAYHALVLLNFPDWSSPLGGVMALLLLAGTASALLVLSGRVGARRKVTATVTALTSYPELKVLETRLRVAEGWPGHQGGQFAFVTIDPQEGAHPYTMASAWDPASREICFITKALGDHTARLPEQLRVGMDVLVEGPYGRFDFRDDRPRQIWVGGGIGITPFIARMKQLAAHGPRADAVIDLFHTTKEVSRAALGKLEADARAAGVRLHVLIDAQDGLLDGERIRRAVPDWQQASVWFCGPEGFGQALHRDFTTRGLPAGHFHREWFRMR